MSTDDARHFDPDALIDYLKAHFDAPDDRALSQCLALPLPLLRDLRAGRAPFSASLMLMLEEATGSGIAELRKIMGDRRACFRIATQHPVKGKRLAPCS